MAHIQKTDRNPSDLGLIEELTDGELLAINGGTHRYNLPRIPAPPWYSPSAWYEDLYYEKMGRLPRAI